MPVIVGIRFKDSGKTYYFDPNGHTPLNQGDQVIVETVRGPELAKVAYSPRMIEAEEVVGELKTVLRYAEPNDFERLLSLNARQTELLARCNEKVIEHNLPMRLVKAEYSFDGSRLTFYFTSEKRVDFRLLVRDLARLFRARIELRQIGPRDEAKLLGGIGPCGRMLCCATFLPDYARVSIKMAKDQDLPLNPIKISGVCGRLLCCLAYEHEQYLEIKAELPKKGAWVQTPDGPGEVVAVNVVRETVMVELAASMTQEEYAPAQLSTATEQVARIARSRNEEGITPAAATADPQSEQAAHQQQRRDRRPHHEPPPRRDRGERRLLRDEIDNLEVLDALSMLEEGRESDEEEQPPPSGAGPAVAHEARSGPAEPGRSGQPGTVRRPIHAQRRTQSPQPPLPRPPQPEHQQTQPAHGAKPQQEQPGRSKPNQPNPQGRRRRRKG